MHVSARLFVPVVCLSAAFFACTVTTTPLPGGDFSSSSSGALPPFDAGASDDGKAPPPDAATHPPDAAPPVDAAQPVDHTPIMTFSLNGKDQTLTGAVTVTKSSDGYVLKAIYPGVFPDPLGQLGNGWLTLGLRDKAGAACTTDKNYAAFFYQEQDSTLTNVNATGLEGSCSITITRLGEDGLVEGKATGTFVNTTYARSWPFTVTWRQPTP
jgi:hypothetical protein